MSDNQQKQLFTELSCEQAATVEGGTVYIQHQGDVAYSFGFWDKTDQSWKSTSLAPGETWTFGAEGDATTMHYQYAPGQYVTQDLHADQYYVLGRNPSNNNWQMYYSDVSYTSISGAGAQPGYPAPPTGTGGY